MKHWKRSPLAEITTSIAYGVTASATWDSTGPKFLRITDIRNGAVDWKQVPRCNATAKSAINKAKLEPGDIVFARTGATTGKSFLVRECPNDAVFASYLIRIRVTSEIDPEYLYQFFQTSDYWSQIKATAQGVAQPGVNSSSLRKLSIPIPPMGEQLRIAEVLKMSETLRENRQQAITQLDSLTESIFMEMFGDSIAKPAATVPLGSITEIASGLTKGRKLNGTTTRTVPYLAVANVQDRELNLSNVKHIDATEAEIRRYRLEVNDLVLTEGGDPDKLGRGTLWRGELDECIHQNHIFRVRVRNQSILPIFLSFLVGSPYGKRYFLRLAKQTTGIASINMSQLRGFPIITPTLGLQEEFARRVEAIEKLKAAQLAQLSQLDSLFASLQDRAFRGEL